MHEEVASFLKTRPHLAHPMGADNQCRIASDELVDALRQRDIAATPVWVRKHRTPPRDPAPRAMSADRHRLARLPDGGFVDVTRRQFDSHAEHPTFYQSEADLAAHWQQIDRGPVDGPLAAEDWRDLEPSS